MTATKMEAGDKSLRTSGPITQEAGRTPGPWIALPPAAWAGLDDDWVILGVAVCGHGELSAANAAFIVRACNAHDDLVAALRAWLAYAEEKLSDFDMGADDPCVSETLCSECKSSGCIQLKIDSARAALLKATGSAS